MSTCQDLLNEIYIYLSGGSRDPFDGSTTVTHEFPKTMTQFVINNDGDESLTFTINGETWTVLRGEQFDDRFDEFDEVTVTTTVPFRAYGRE